MRFLLLILLSTSNAYGTRCFKASGDWNKSVCKLEPSKPHVCLGYIQSLYCSVPNPRCENNELGCFGFIPVGHWVPVPNNLEANENLDSIISEEEAEIYYGKRCQC